MLTPGSTAPTLGFNTLRHGAFDLSADAPPGGTFLSFFRGGHCKWTRFYLKELDDRIGDFALRGIRVVALSSEGRDATQALVDRMQLIRLPMGYGLDVETTAAAWGLYLTRGATEDDAPALHWEPAQAWIRADGALGAIAVQSGPNLWADMTQTIRGIENTMNKHPERGAG